MRNVSVYSVYNTVGTINCYKMICEGFSEAKFTFILLKSPLDTSRPLRVF